MAQFVDCTPGKRVECYDDGVMQGAKGTIQINGSGLYNMDNGYIWVAWDNPDNRAELVPAWIKHTFLKIIKGK